MTPGRRLQRELPGLLLLLLAVVFEAILAAPELRIGEVTPNDSMLHMTASERLHAAFVRGEPFLDPWVSEWSLGYPVWRSYQPLPHAFAAATFAIVGDRLTPSATFAALTYALLLVLPISAWAGARLLGMRPAAAGLLALFVLAPSATGELGRYGIGQGAYLWRGSGVYTQLFALCLLTPALGLVRRALDRGRGHLLAAGALAAVALAHMVFGYVAFVSSALLAVVGARGHRTERLLRLVGVAMPAIILLLFHLVPLFVSREWIGASRWENTYKWDSYGAPSILRDLVRGRLLDHGRPPVLTALVALGAIVAALRRQDPLARRLLALAGLWLALFFGRATWGHLLVLLAVPAELHLHRLQAAFELAALGLAAWGTVEALSRVRRPVVWAAVAALALALLSVGCERARYHGRNAAWGEANLAAHELQRRDVERSMAEIRSILSIRPGRVSAGLAADWGRDFKVGAVPLYAYLTRNHLDQVSFLYHSMSRTSDVMVLRDEDDRAHQVAFGVRAVIAPSDREMPSWLNHRSTYGRLSVYESSPEGYFGIVDVAAWTDGDPESSYQMSARWLRSPWLRAGVVVALGDGGRELPRVEPTAPLPAVPAASSAARGTIVEETRTGEVYRAQFELARPAFAFVKMTYHPDLEATVDGEPAPVVHVTPGFAAVPVPAGRHQVEVTYRPTPWKVALLPLAIVAVLGQAAARRRSRRDGGPLAARIADATLRAWTPRRRATVALAMLTLLALRPLVRGQLVDGHDALEYPPRLVEAEVVLADRHLPPVWAPDLGNGYGQPLFAFAPPLVYGAGLPFRLLGLGLADSLQFGLLALHAIGAAAIYRLARDRQGGRVAAVGAATAWLFAPYVSLDLFVRAAYAEASAVAVAPLALYLLDRALRSPSAARIAAASGAVGLVILGHNAAALLVLPFLVVFAAVRAWPDRRRLATAGLAVAGGLALTAYFWVPALIEKQYVKVHLLREGLLLWSEHSVAPVQLLWSRWGHGLSVAGPGDGMSFQIGPLHLLLAAFGLWVARGRAGRGERLVLSLAAVGGAWLATDLAAPLWHRVELLQFLAYPWRALMLPALALPLLTVPAFARLGGRAPLAIAVLVLVNLVHTEPRAYARFDDAEFAPQEIARRGVNTTTREEYEPRWVEARPPYRERGLTSLGRPIEIAASSRSAVELEFDVVADEASSVEAATFYYPGWRVLVDDVPVPHRPLPRSGTIAFEVPAGAHSVRLVLEPTPLRRRATAVSAATFIALLAAALITRRRRSSSADPRPEVARRAAPRRCRSARGRPDDDGPADRVPGPRPRR